jgi:hydroxyacylglutathione hydrolase
MPVHLLRGGYANTYVIEDGNSLVAVDVGTSSAATKIHQYLSNRSLPAPALQMVTATHFHMDHVGGISQLLHLFPEIRICFITVVEDYLKRNKKLALFAPSKWLKGLVPIVMAEDNHLKKTAAALLSDKFAIPLPLLRTHLPSDFEPKCVLDEGQPIPYLPHWKLLRTPGHTPDSICFYNSDERSLISGDTILNMRGRGELNTFCSNCDSIKKSFKRLVPLTIHTLYPGHGEPLHNIDGLSRIVQ